MGDAIAAFSLRCVVTLWVGVITLSALLDFAEWMDWKPITLVVVLLWFAALWRPVGAAPRHYATPDTKGER